MAASIFERCGGFAQVRRVVSVFYDKVLESESLQRYFLDTDMRDLIDHQTKFVSTLMGGPASYSDEVLQRVHEPLGIGRADFREAAQLLRETLEEFDFERADIEHVCQEFLRREPLIVGRLG